MKNPLMDALKQLKAKRIAVVVADADELGIPNSEGGLELGADAGLEDDDLENDELEMDLDSAPGEDAAEIAEDDQTDHAMEDSQEDDEEHVIPRKNASAEEVMGRKPFSKAGSSSEDELDEDVADELYDPDMVDKMESSGRKPKGLMERAQANLAKRFKK